MTNPLKQLPDNDKALVYDAVSDAYEKVSDQQRLWQTATNYMNASNARAKRLNKEDPTLNLDENLTFSEARQILAELEIACKVKQEEEGVA